MMKRTLRFALTPFMLIARLMLGLAAFISSIASAVIGLAVGLFAVLSVIEFAIGYWQNGIAFMVLALLASPIGLPAVANFLLNRMDHIRTKCSICRNPAEAKPYERDQPASSGDP